MIDRAGSEYDEYVECDGGKIMPGGGRFISGLDGG